MVREPAIPKGSAGASPDFVGREDELTAVVTALSDGAALVIVEGEPGMGKTRLVRRATGSLTDLTVLSCTCPPLSEPFPLGPIVDGIRRLGQDRVPEGLSPIAGALRPLFPEWSALLPPALEPLDTAGETRHRVFRALTELLDRLEVSVLILEDAHWADTATLELLLTLVAAGGVSRSLVVTFRPAELGESPTLLRLTSRVPVGMSRVRVELAPLSVEETGRLVGSMFGSDQVSSGFAAFLHRHTDGVPLAVEECVRLLTDRRDIVRREGQWIRRVLDELEVPPTVRDSVLERVTRLPPKGRRMLEATAVLGVPADVAMLGEVADRSAEDVQDGLAVALSSGLVQESTPGRFAFRHALDAQAVGESVPASRWRHLHARAVTTWERLQPDALDRLIRHTREAGDADAWCRYAEAGADVALQSGDDRNAVTLLLQLLTTVEQPADRRLRLARKLGEAVFYGSAVLGDLADQVVEAMRCVVDDPRLVSADRGELRLLLGRTLWRAGRRTAAYSEFEAAVPDLDHRPDLQGLTMCNLAMPLVPDWPTGRHLGWLGRAVELVAAVDSRQLEVAVCTARAAALLLLGDRSAWEAVAAIDRPRSARPRELSMLASGLLNVAASSLPWGRFEETRRLLHAAGEVIPDSDHHRVAEGSQIAEAILAWYTGGWDGLADVLTALVVAESTEMHDRLLARLLATQLEFVTGSGALGDQGLREVVADLQGLGITEPTTVLPAAVLARAALREEGPDRALELTAPAVEVVARKGVWLWLTDIAAVHVEALVRSGGRAEAEALVATFADSLDLDAAPAPAAAVETCRAVLAESAGDLEAAATRYARSAAAWASIPRPYDELMALESQGRCLLAAARSDEAMPVLAGAQAGLAALGARRDSDRIARLLREHGAEVARTWRRGRRGYGEELSPREREVLALVARGMTNREVGEALFLSPRTVGRHLGSAMRKLQVTTRTAAAMAATEAGLLAPPDHPAR